MSVDVDTRDVDVGRMDQDDDDDDLEVYKRYNESKSETRFLQWLAKDVGAPETVPKIGNALQAYERELLFRAIREKIDDKFLHGSRSVIIREGG